MATTLPTPKTTPSIVKNDRSLWSRRFSSPDRIGRRHAVDPRSYPVADGLDPIVVPLALLERGPSLGLALEIVQPAPAALIVDAAAPGSRGGVDLDLVAVDAVVVVVLVAVAANLDAGVHARLGNKLQFQNEVRVHLLCAQEAVRRVEDGRPDDRAILDRVFGFSVFWDPAVQGLAIKERLPIRVSANRHTGKHKRDQ
jgi:hypothetical protein